MQHSDSNSGSSCSIPPELTDVELLDAIDGEANPSIQAHLARCAHCSARLEDFRAMEHALKVRADCPPAEQLADYTMRLLMTSDRAQIDHHLGRCALCRQEVELLKATFTPEEVRTPEPRLSRGARPRRFFPSFSDIRVRILQPSLATSSGAVKGTGARSRVFESGPISVMLSLESIAGRVKVNVIISDLDRPSGWKGGYADFADVVDGQRMYPAQIDEDHTLTLNDVVPGIYNVSFYSIGGEILRLQNLELIP
jgi:hypothetical protein